MTNLQSDLSNSLVDQLRLVLGKMEAALSVVDDAIVIIDSEGLINWSNASFETLVCSEPTFVVGENFLRLFSRWVGGDIAPVFIDKFISFRKQLVVEVEVDRNQGVDPLVCRVLAKKIAIGPSDHTIVTITDISSSISTERLKKENDDLQAKVSRCPLTGLWNAKAFRSHADNLLKDQVRSGHTLAFYFCDLNGFKAVNDTYGHKVGDALLVEVARRLSGTSRPMDIVGRLGGDEFVIICPGVANAEQAVMVAERMRSEICRSFFWRTKTGDIELLPDCSIGISLSLMPGSNVDELMNNADIAMYKAKKLNSSSKVCLFANQEASDRSHFLLRDYLEAVEPDSLLKMHVQPVVNPRDGSISMFECFLAPVVTGGVTLFPADLIDLADNSSMVAEAFGVSLVRSALHSSLSFGLSQPESTRSNSRLSRFLSADSCRLESIYARSHAGTLVSDSCRLAINISVSQASSPAFEDAFLELLDDFKLSPASIVLEVRGSIFDNRRLDGGKFVSRMRRLGFSVYLSGYGVGRSDLLWLVEHPFDGLKIDRCFFSSTESSLSSRALLEGLIKMVQGLGVSVVVEGVETSSQAEWLASVGCDFAQGFFYAHPC